VFLTMDVPGVKLSDIRLEYLNGELQVHGQRKNVQNFFSLFTQSNVHEAYGSSVSLPLCHQWLGHLQVHHLFVEHRGLYRNPGQHHGVGVPRRRVRHRWVHQPYGGVVLRVAGFPQHQLRGRSVPFFTNTTCVGMHGITSTSLTCEAFTDIFLPFSNAP